MNDDLELLTIRELAALAKVHRSTIYRAEQAGQLTFVYVGPRSPRIRKADAERFLAGLTVEVAAQ